MQRTAKRYYDDGHGKDVGIETAPAAFAVVTVAARALPPQSEQTNLE